MDFAKNSAAQQRPLLRPCQRDEVKSAESDVAVVTCSPTRAWGFPNRKRFCAWLSRGYPVVLGALLFFTGAGTGLIANWMQTQFPRLLPGGHEYAKFLVIGDWGREGYFNQTLVADSMAVKAAKMGIDFVLSTGDNFYPSGVRSGNDDTFDKSFVDVYHHASLQVPWHAVLGNHDYGETKPDEELILGKNASAWLTEACGGWSNACYYSPLHELSVPLVERDARWHCQRSFSLTLGPKGELDMFFIDTTPAIKPYYSEEWAAYPGGIKQQSWASQRRELETALATSRAQWKVVIGHHPVRSNHRTELEELLPELEPILERYGAQVYMNGHDHNLQYIHEAGSPVHYIISGAGSKIGHGFFHNNTAPFLYDDNGYVAVTVQPHELVAEYMGVDPAEPLFVARIPLR